MDSLRRLLFYCTHPLIRLYWCVFQPKTFGAKALIFHEKNVLLSKNIHAKKWGLPGGMIEKGETPSACLLRELEEELHLRELKISFKLGEYSSQQEGKYDTVHVFVIHLASPTFKKAWELQSAEWFPLAHLPEDISPATRRRIEEYHAGKRELKVVW